MITVTDLTKTYQTGDNVKINALNNLSLEINDGELLFIMGKSGSGKSTLLHMLGGLDKPTCGSIKYDGTEITSMSESRLSVFRRDNIGFVFQEYNLIPELSAEENIKYPVFLAKKKADKQLWDFLIETLQLADRLSHLPSQLSGGQQQRVAIARALMLDPQIVLCDEPTGNLDSESSAAVQNVLFQLNEQLDKTTVIVTHDGEFAQRAVGKRVITIKDGVIEREEIK